MGQNNVAHAGIGNCGIQSVLN